MLFAVILLGTYLLIMALGNSDVDDDDDFGGGMMIPATVPTP